VTHTIKLVHSRHLINVTLLLPLIHDFNHSYLVHTCGKKKDDDVLEFLKKKLLGSYVNYKLCILMI
jgi:hypothetical protein